MIMRASGCVLIAAALALTGCVTTQTAGAKPSSFPNLLVGPETAAELGTSIQWQTPLALPARTRLTQIELIEGRLVMLDSANVAYVVNADNGKLLWSSRIGKDLERFYAPRLDDKRLVLCSETRAYFFSLEHGDDLGFIDLYYGTNTAPAIVSGLMLHGNGAGMIWGQDLSIGLRRWNYKLPGAVMADPVIAGSGVLFTNAAGFITMFNPAEGTVLWQQKAFDRISAEPIATDLLVYVASEDHSVYAFERTTGNMRWRHFARDPIYKSPALTASMLLVDESRKGTVALDSFSGEEKWVNPLRMADFVQETDGLLLLHAEKALHRVAVKSGETYQTIPIPGVDTVLSDNPKGGNLFLIDRNAGRILKLSPR